MSEFTKNESNWRGCFRDWAVVLWSYFCGKVLRRKNYLPQDAGNNMSVLHGLPRMTSRRVLLLMKLWGYRPLMLDELKRLQEKPRSHADYFKQVDHCRVPSRCLRTR